MRQALIGLLALMLGAAAPAESFDRVADALAAGLAADRDHDMAGRARAAAVLAAEGARPMARTADFARAWSRPGSRPPYRDRALGPGYRTMRLASGETAQLQQTFLAGRQARVLAFSRGAADFSLTVRDDEGTRPCEGGPTRAECNWLPVYTARITISLANRAERPGDFLLLVR